MSLVGDTQQLSLQDIGRRCRQETEAFFQLEENDPRYGFELFRRAIQERQQEAWDMLCKHYHPLVTRWVKRRASNVLDAEEIDYLTNGAFAKMWLSLTPAKFDQFPDLKSLLRYLQMCAQSVAIDNARKYKPCISLEEAELSTNEIYTEERAIEDQALAMTYKRELWRSLAQRLSDQKEQKVAFGYFMLALKPREIQAQYPDTFRTVNEVYRTKENVITRLRRDAGFKGFFSWLT